MPFEFFISKRYLKSKNQGGFLSLITLLSIAGVAVGVMALLVVIAVMTGAKTELRNKILGVESHILLMRYGAEFYDYQEKIETVKKFDSVVSATPFIYSQIIIKSASNTSGAVLKGIDFNSSVGTVEQSVKKITAQYLKTAEYQKGKKQIPKVILGKSLAEAMGVDAGDTVYFMLPKGRVSPIGYIPVMKRVAVAGIFDSGMSEYDSSIIYAPLEDARQILNMEKVVNGIAINVKDIYKAGEVLQEILTEAGPSYWGKDWMSMNKNLFSALKMEKTAMFIILILIVLVAAFNIASMLIMMVMEKRKDIAILKAMGASDKIIKKIFILKGLTIGGIGTLIGVVFGVCLTFALSKYKFISLPEDIYFFATLPVELKLTDIIVITSSSLFICFLATIYPARQAARLNPVDAIRYG